MEAIVHDPEERAQLIITSCLQEKSADPRKIFMAVASQPFVRMHGPEHHVLVGAAFLTAYNNAGGKVDLPAALAELARRAQDMPGGMCGTWGVCGGVASVGAALSILEGTGPHSDDNSWASHMRYTSRALSALSSVDGPRCCKRDAFLALREAVRYARERFGVDMEMTAIVCPFSKRNPDCAGTRCPFHAKERKPQGVRVEAKTLKR